MADAVCWVQKPKVKRDPGNIPTSVPYRPEGCEDFLQHLQQSLLPAGGDVVLGQLEEGKAVLALTPHMLHTQIMKIFQFLSMHFKHNRAHDVTVSHFLHWCSLMWAVHNLING